MQNLDRRSQVESVLSCNPLGKNGDLIRSGPSRSCRTKANREPVIEAVLILGIEKQSCNVAFGNSLLGLGQVKNRNFQSGCKRTSNQPS